MDHGWAKGNLPSLTIRRVYMRLLLLNVLGRPTIAEPCRRGAIWNRGMSPAEAAMRYLFLRAR